MIKAAEVILGRTSVQREYNFPYDGKFPDRLDGFCFDSAIGTFSFVYCPARAGCKENGYWSMDVNLEGALEKNALRILEARKLGLNLCRFAQDIVEYSGGVFGDERYLKEEPFVKDEQVRGHSGREIDKALGSDIFDSDGEESTISSILRNRGYLRAQGKI